MDNVQKWLSSIGRQSNPRIVLGSGGGNARGWSNVVVTPDNIPTFTIPKSLDSSPTDGAPGQDCGDSMDEKSPSTSSLHSLSASPMCHSPRASSLSLPPTEYFKTTRSRSAPGSPMLNGGKYEPDVMDQPETFKCNSSINISDEYKTNVDPLSAAALGLTHFKTRTSYGFDTLSTRPHTKRKESLFLDVATSHQMQQFAKKHAALADASGAYDADSDETPSRSPINMKRNRKRAQSVNKSTLLPQHHSLTSEYASSSLDIPLKPRVSLPASKGSGSFQNLNQAALDQDSYQRSSLDDYRYAALDKSSDQMSTCSSYRSTSGQCDSLSSCESINKISRKSPHVTRYPSLPTTFVQSHRPKRTQTIASASNLYEKPRISLTPSSAKSEEHIPSCDWGSSQSLNRSLEDDLDAVDLDENDVGEVSLTLRYIPESKRIMVHGLRCKHLQTDGESYNTFINLYLMPGKVQKHTTKVIRGSPNPEFPDTIYFNKVEYKDIGMMRLRIKVYRRLPNLQKHALIGETEIIFQNMNLVQDTTVRRELQTRVNAQVSGRLYVEGCFDPSKDQLQINIQQASKLPKHALTGAPDSCVKLTVSQLGKPRQKQKTRLFKRSSDPAFRTTFNFAVSPRTQDMNYTSVILTVINRNRLPFDDVIGHVRLGLGSTEESEREQWKKIMSQPGVWCGQWHVLNPSTVD